MLIGIILSYNFPIFRLLIIILFSIFLREKNQFPNPVGFPACLFFSLFILFYSLLNIVPFGLELTFLGFAEFGMDCTLVRI